MKTESLILAVLFLLTGCSSGKLALTRDSAPVMRVMLDPDSIQGDDYNAIQALLVESGKWFVVDRSAGYRAALKEQDRLHRGKTDRFDDTEKYALFKKLYGVGGVITAHERCDRQAGVFSVYLRCSQTISLTDATTGQVIAATRWVHEGEPSEWSETVERFNQSLPKYMPALNPTSEMKAFRELAKVHASEQKTVKHDFVEEEQEISYERTAE
jgi:hypothetical protein